MTNKKKSSFSSWPSFTREEADAVSAVLLSNKVNYWTGKEGKKFESEFASWCACDYGIAVSNGTVALELALKGLGIGAGDEVIVTPRTFIASVSCVVNIGATPVFADVDMDSQNIHADSIAAVLSEKTRAVICVHLAGWPCEMDAIMALAAKHDFKVIEDCAQAHGARYKDKAVGSIGHIGAWSFCQDKIMTTGGEGGMVTCNDKALWSRMWSYKDHGKDWAASNNNRSAGFSWVHDSFGVNGRMTEIQAAIGLIQLARMADWHAQRTANAELLAALLQESGLLRIPLPSRDIVHAWYKFTAFLRTQELAEGWDRDRIVAEINAEGVACRFGPCPEVYLEKAFDNTAYRPLQRLPNARALGETSIMFFIHPTLQEAEIRDMSKIINRVLLKAIR